MNDIQQVLEVDTAFIRDCVHKKSCPRSTVFIPQYWSITTAADYLQVWHGGDGPVYCGGVFVMWFDYEAAELLRSERDHRIDQLA